MTAREGDKLKHTKNKTHDYVQKNNAIYQVKVSQDSQHIIEV